jgi:Immunity protein 17
MHSASPLLILIGLFVICAAIYNWDWFMESGKNAFLSQLLGGRPGIRIFFLVLGLAIAAWGFLDVFGILD